MPKWLVWADSSRRNNVVAGMAQWRQINVREFRDTAQGLNITGRYTNKNKTDITFIVLEAQADGQKFRQVLDGAMKKVAK